MALIDVLPSFRYKPLELSTTPKTQLVPKSNEDGTEIPQIITKPVETIKDQSVKKSSIALPAQYKSMDPLLIALEDSTIVNPKAKLAVISQMGLEKGWKLPEDYSYGNIVAGKTWTGPVQIRPDRDANGNPIKQTFRSYGSAKEFVDDYMKLLRTQYPDAYEALHADNFDINRFTSGLVDGKYKYAQDTKYKNKVTNVYFGVLKNTLGII